MTRKEYLRKLDEISRRYDSMRKQWQQSDGRMMLVLKQEENERKLQLTQHFYAQDDKAIA